MFTKAKWDHRLWLQVFLQPQVSPPPVAFKKNALKEGTSVFYLSEPSVIL